LKHGRLTRIIFFVALALLPGISSGCGASNPLVQVYGGIVPRFTDDLDRGSIVWSWCRTPARPSATPAGWTCSGAPGRKPGAGPAG